MTLSKVCVPGLTPNKVMTLTGRFSKARHLPGGRDMIQVQVLTIHCPLHLVTIYTLKLVIQLKVTRHDLTARYFSPRVLRRVSAFTITCTVIQSVL